MFKPLSGPDNPPRATLAQTPLTTTPGNPKLIQTTPELGPVIPLLQQLTQQDLSLKCSAWASFIPHLQWKFPSPKQKFGSKKIMGMKKIGV